MLAQGPDPPVSGQCFRKGQDERNADGRFVQPVMVEIDAMFPQAFSVVRVEDHQGFVDHVQIFQRPNQFPHIVVNVADGPVI